MIFYIINKSNILLVYQGTIHKPNLSYLSCPCRKNVGKNDKISNDFKKVLIWATSSCINLIWLNLPASTTLVFVSCLRLERISEINRGLRHNFLVSSVISIPFTFN